MSRTVNEMNGKVEEPMEQHEDHESDHELDTISGDERLILDLTRENSTLRNWLVGVLEGCEGCTEEANAWRQARQVQDSDEEVEEAT